MASESADPGAGAGVVMADLRRKDVNWTLPDTETVSFDGASLAVLMDLRDELRAIRYLLQGTLGCANFKALPRVVSRIARQTDRRPKPAAVAKRRVA